MFNDNPSFLFKITDRVSTNKLKFHLFIAVELFLDD